jgi:hypothetical protein
MKENTHFMGGLTDADVHPPLPDYDNCTYLEVVVNLLHPDGNRTSPQVNRIRVPLQVDTLTREEYLFLTQRINGAIGSLFLRDEFLHRLVRRPSPDTDRAGDSDSAVHKLRGLSYMPVLDRIGIPEIRPIGPEPSSHREKRSSLHPDAYDESCQAAPKTGCCDGRDHSGSTR